MKNIKEELINKIIEEFKREQVKRIPFLIAPLEQHLNSENFEELFKDLDKKDFYIQYEEDHSEGYTNGSITIELQEKSEGELEDEESYSYTNDHYVNYNYEITFDYDPRHWGYCQCDTEDKDYDSRYRCCGHGCDWTAPSFKIVKHESLGGCSWTGDEHDFWDFKDKFNNIDNKQLEEDKKQAEIKYIQEQIEYYSDKLEKAKNS